ncbi:MAG: hypothetical protein J7K39_01675 [Bacteroidales bacterium]|nr:hypothetical protein [Bacteroidales bacterium]RLD37593.1 MAG: 3-hydroxyacyl-ACP dehydratase [Bacteroidota bacterium]
MLKNDFYTIARLDRVKNKLTGIFQLNISHSIFQGHFPDIPVVPGVVLIQMIKEVLEEDFACKLVLKEAKNIKFLNFINPKEINELDFEIIIKSKESETIKVQAIIDCKKVNYFKISANYKLIKD